jgi:hypothetical protein
VTDNDQEDEEDGLPFWKQAALARVREILETAEYDPDEGTVSLAADEWDLRGKGRFTSRTFSSLEELRKELVELGDSEITAHVHGRVVRSSAQILTTWLTSLWTRLVFAVFSSRSKRHLNPNF